MFKIFFFNDTATTEIYTLSLHDALPIYNTGRRINNGLIKLGHTVQTLSDRDTISHERKLSDPAGSKSLNNKLLEIV